MRRATEEPRERLGFELSPEEVAGLQRLKQQRHPLGWPPGSVRALLTLMLVCYVCIELLLGTPPSVLWTETLLIAVAHYFTARRHAALPRSIRDDLVRMDLLPAEEHPLGLPQHSIRTMIAGAFVLVFAYLVMSGRPPGGEAVGLFLALAAFLIGNFVRADWAFATKHAEIEPPWGWGDLKPLATLTAMLLALGFSLSGRFAPPPVPLDTLEKSAAAMALYYFGSR